MRFFAVIAIALIAASCTKEIPDVFRQNVPPKSFLWLFPDSTVSEGISKQHLHWWGEDPDGTVKGFLFASGKILDSTGKLLDTVGYSWRTGNDTLIAFPLVKERDTFQVAVRAVDNTFLETLPETLKPVVRLSPSPYWDKNADGIYDAGDVPLGSLARAVDTGSARLQLPVLNQPPSVVFAPNPNDPSVTMQQPETTFTAATFAWVGSDPDGDQTIAAYEIALNDTTDPSRRFTVRSTVQLVSLIVPRTRSDTLSGVTEVSADVYSGTYFTGRYPLGAITHLRLNALNTFYVRARDIAGDVSPFKGLPDPNALPLKRWFVKQPLSKALIVDDYILADRDAALSILRNALGQSGYPSAEVLDVGRGLSSEDKRDNKPGIMVPPFVDPALVNTLHLFDLVLWYTDPFPSLGVAREPLHYFVQDGTHPGKVIYSTMFETSNDPRGALTDFAPLDSISSVDLSSANPLLPRPGDTRIQQGFRLYPDSSAPGGIYPELQFTLDPNPQRSYSLFMRPAYKRPDARYIYHIQKDTRPTIRYALTPTLFDLNAVTSQGQQLWACGEQGTIIASPDGGLSWKRQKSGATTALYGIHFLSPTHGWIVGENATILETTDGGASWINRSRVEQKDLYGVAFPSSSVGIAVGENGILIRTADGGRNWGPTGFRTSKSIRAIDFIDANSLVAVGDSGLTIRSTDAGSSWRTVLLPSAPRLNSVRYIDNTTLVAAASSRAIFRSTDGGDTWILQQNLPAAELRSIARVDDLNAWAAGGNGYIVHTSDKGQTWVSQLGPFTNYRTLNSLASGSSDVWAAGTGGIVLHTSDGISWAFQPPDDINVGILGMPDVHGKLSFVFLGLPLHLLDGPAGTGGAGTIVPFLQYVIHREFGL